ncbi:hypothetical protein CPB84DRAFT_282173 [Gymnopilus junonius]|uniref:Uncharacterized protein n=1 Tax=Gymnopilus junonius TaxID=109634 RepID=A0A9P5TIT4_GYMJU|nr:hypothetical protein CPB84DRAFT_282173 [Gymnopilus junonius]
MPRVASHVYPSIFRFQSPSKLFPMLRGLTVDFAHLDSLQSDNLLGVFLLISSANLSEIMIQNSNHTIEVQVSSLLYHLSLETPNTHKIVLYGGPTSMSLNMLARFSKLTSLLLASPGSVIFSSTFLHQLSGMSSLQLLLLHKIHSTGEDGMMSPSTITRESPRTVVTLGALKRLAFLNLEGSEALQVLDSIYAPSLVHLTFKINNMSGPEIFSRRVTETAPSLRTWLSAGNTMSSTAIQLLRACKKLFLMKVSMKNLMHSTPGIICTTIDGKVSAWQSIYWLILDGDPGADGTDQLTLIALSQFADLFPNLRLLDLTVFLLKDSKAIQDMQAEVKSNPRPQCHRLINLRLRPREFHLNSRWPTPYEFRTRPVELSVVISCFIDRLFPHLSSIRIFHSDATYLDWCHGVELMVKGLQRGSSVARNPNCHCTPTSDSLIMRQTRILGLIE